MAVKRRVFRLDLVGEQALMQVLEELPKAVGDAALRAALKKAMEPVVQTARAICTKDDGALAKSIKVSTTLTKTQRAAQRRKGVVHMFAGPSHPEGAHGHLVEFGTGPRFHKKTRKYVGQARPKPFLRPAWDQNKELALEIFRKEIWPILRDAVQRLRKRAERGKLSRSQERFFRR